MRSIHPFLAKGSLLGAPLLISSFFLGYSSVQAQVHEIQWRVENNFRLFKDPVDQEWVRELALESKHPESARFTIRDIRNHWEIIPPTYYDKHTSTYEKGYISPTEWSVRLTSPSSSPGSQCRWTIDGKVLQGPCRDFVPELKFGKGPTRVAVLTPHGRREETVVEIKDILIAVLGDSWISGEGTPDVFRVLKKRNAEWWDQKCHRSLYAWPVLTAARLALDQPKQSVSLVTRACSGAVINDVNNLKGPLSEGVEPWISIQGETSLRPQIEQLQEDLCLGTWDRQRNKCLGGELAQPDYLFLSIGGNDAKFSRIVIDGLIRRINDQEQLAQGRPAGSVTDRLLGGMVDAILGKKKRILNYKEEALKTVKGLEETYPKLAQRLHHLFPSTKVLMSLYPDPLHREPDSLCGRSSSGELEPREDGTPTTDFTMNGIEELVAKMLNRRITNQEVVAIHGDFYMRFTGYENFVDHDWGGLFAIGSSLEKAYPGLWNVLITNRLYPEGTRESLANRQLTGQRRSNHSARVPVASGVTFATDSP